MFFVVPYPAFPNWPKRRSITEHRCLWPNPMISWCMHKSKGLISWHIFSLYISLSLSIIFSLTRWGS